MTTHHYHQSPIGAPDYHQFISTFAASETRKLAGDSLKGNQKKPAQEEADKQEATHRKKKKSTTGRTRSKTAEGPTGRTRSKAEGPRA